MDSMVNTGEAQAEPEEPELDGIESDS
jgi:hypothetical protein